MAQLYNPPLGRLMRSLLLQCVIMLGLVSVGMAQAYPDPLFYEGPWRVNAPTNVTTSGLSSDGADITPSNTGGSAQLRTMAAFVDVKLQDAAGTGQTGYKVSFSLRATASTTMRLSYRTVSERQEGEVVETINVDALYNATTASSRHSIYLPSNATNIRFQRAEENTTYLFLDAIEVSQQPEFGSFSPSFGVPGTEVTITGVHLDETSKVFFGAIEATPDPSDITSKQVVVAVPTGATSSLLKVVTPYGEAISGTQFIVPAPEFAKAAFTTEPEFSPATAGPGDTVTLNGRYFTGATTVQFNSVNAPGFTFVTDSKIKVIIPLAATSGPITVTTPADVATSARFAVLGPQIIALEEGENAGLEFTPSTGAVGTPVTIYGKYFLAATEVLFNGAQAIFTAVNDSVITTTVPVGASTGFITVKSPAGEDNTSTEFAVPAPAFANYTVDGSQFLPTSAGPGMQIRLFGTNLASASRVVFLGAEGEEDDRAGSIVTPLTSSSDTELIVTVPADATSGRIQIFAPGLSGTEVSTTSEQVFIFVPAPTIAAVANTTGDLTVEDGITYGLVGEEVTITGTNFETATTVTLGNATIVKADAENDIEGFSVNQEGTEINFNIPASVTTSTGSVKVNTLGGEATWGGAFDVILKPVIATMTPLAGPRGGKITLTGSSLKYVSEVVFLGADGIANESDARVTFTGPNASDTELKFVIPANAETGKLIVVNPAGETETAVFTIVRNPEILTITPNQGAAGTTVTMTGYNFLNEAADGGATMVTFVGAEGAAIPAANLTITTDSTMTFNVPVGAITGVITVANTFGSDTSEEFFIYQLPTIASFTPERGIIGNQVVISGTNFYEEGMVVTFLGVEGDDTDNVNATIISVNVAEQTITATVPTGAVTGELMVTNAAGSATSKESYEVVTTAEILSFTPTKGKVTTPVTITGWLMQNVTHVGFHGTLIAVTPSTDGKTISTTVPAGATTGPLSLYEGGTSVFTTTDIFEVIPVPTIYSFSPTSGVAETEVTITGTNLEGITAILFNEAAVEDLTGIVLTPVDIEGVTYQQFTVAVPNDATTGFITITAAGGTVVSDDEFEVPVPANITFTPQISYANQLVTISGRFFKNIERITFNGRAADTTGITVVKNGEIESFTIKAPFDAGTGPIAITTSAGTGTSTDSYTVIEPVITLTTLQEGYAERTVITISGENFTKYWNEALGAEDDAEPIVEFAGVNNTRVRAIVEPGYTNNSITVTVPANARTGGITVRSESGISAPYNFEVLAPTITAVNPTSVYAGQRVTVTGTNYVDVSSISYSGIAIAQNDVTGYKVINETTIEFVAPVMPVSSNNRLTITTLSGSVTSTLLTVYKPIIASVVKDRVYAGVSTVTITGTRFDEYYDDEEGIVTRAVPTVTFTGANSTRIPAIIQSATYSTDEAGTDVLVVEVPANAVAGRVQVASGSGTGQSESITIIGAPTITGFTPAAQVVGGLFTINGDNLDEAVSVTFLGREGVADEFTVNSADFISNTSTAITLNVPANAVAGKVMVTTPHDSTSTFTSKDIFRIVKAPVITSIDEASQQATQTITLRGANLWDIYTDNPSGAIKVWFRGHGTGITIPAPANEQVEIAATVRGYDDVNGDWVTVEVPRDAITGVIKVQNAAGTFTTTTEFEVTSPVIVRFEDIDNVEINSGNRARINERVLIRGYQLTDIGSVKIGSTNVPSFEEVIGDPTTARIIVPTGARTNTVQVTSLGYTETSNVELEIVTPVITVNPTVLSFKAATETNGTWTYDEKPYTVTATNLAVGENLTISLSANQPYQLFDPNANDGEGGWTAQDLTLSPDASGNLTKTIRVRSRNLTEVNDTGGQRSTTVIARHTSLEAITREVTLQAEIVPLPVELIAFNAAKQKSGVLLTWATASELDNDYFEVQVSDRANGGFKAVGQVKSRVNTTAIRQDYKFEHKGHFTGTRYYRLKQVDLDGTTEFSKVVAVTSNDAELVVGARVYPNPVNSTSQLEFTTPEAGKLNVTIVNMNGSRIQRMSYDVEAGTTKLELNLSDRLPTGMYILTTEFNGKTQQVKLLKN